MTARRVIDDHRELDNVGSIPHAEIDTHVSSSQFLVLSSSANVPPTARTLVLGAGLKSIDEGPNGNLQIYIDPDYLPSASFPRPTVVGSMLYAPTTSSFVEAVPIATRHGFLVTQRDGYMVVNSVTSSN